MYVVGNPLNAIKKSIVKVLVIIAFLLLSQTGLQAQVSESEIKLSREFYWGEATAESVEEARNMARRDLATRIVSTIRTESRLVSSEIDGEFSQSYVQNVQSESNLQIRGLDYLDIPRRNYIRSIAYIRIVDYDKQVAEQIDKARAIVRNAQLIEIESGLDKALPEYLLAWSEARYIPTSLFVSQGLDSLDINTLVRQKIRSWAESISLKVNSVDGGLINDSDVAINVQIEASFLGNPVGAAKIRWSESGYGFHDLLDGKVNVFYDKLPNRAVERKRILIAPSLNILPNSSTDILDILAVEKSIDLSFNSIAGVDIEILNNQESSLNLRALISNLSVNRIEWFVGNTSIGTTQDITIPKSRLLSQALSLVVNRDTAMTVRRIWRNNQLVDLENTSETSAMPTLISSEIRETPLGVVTSNYFDLENDPIANELVQIVDYQILMNWLRSQSRVGNISFGAVGEDDSVDNYPEAYIVLINPIKQTVVSVLSKEKDTFREIFGLNKRIIDPAVEFKGQGVGSIWVEIR
jgi:hypothetical protein